MATAAEIERAEHGWLLGGAAAALTRRGWVFVDETGGQARCRMWRARAEFHISSPFPIAILLAFWRWQTSPPQMVTLWVDRAGQLQAEWSEGITPSNIAEEMRHRRAPGNVMLFGRQWSLLGLGARLIGLYFLGALVVTIIGGLA